jgi:hypothetical protein
MSSHPEADPTPVLVRLGRGDFDKEGPFDCVRLPGLYPRKETTIEGFTSAPDDEEDLS